ncbi:MAG: formylmethanofuran--tetrahydromethanopterin N-formyltransferase [Planctomycetota bacterium]
MREPDGATPTATIGATPIADTYAEAFRARYARLIVTAIDDHWLDAAVREFCGYGTSVIGCDAEAAVEQRLTADETPDGRPGASVLAFAFAAEPLGKAVAARVGQCVMTCPTTAVFDGLPAAQPAGPSEPDRERAPLGKFLRYFADGYQKRVTQPIGGQQRSFWRLPVMDGEFLVEESIGIANGVAGGNIIVQGTTQSAALASARRVVDALALRGGVITPFPGGVVRSGSKVGSRYRGLVASTNDAFCPTLRARVDTALHADAQAAYEVVFNGVDEEAVAASTTTALHAAAGDGVVEITAGNYGGKLGKFHFHLRELL